MKSSTKKVLNIIFRIISLVSFLILILFCVYIYRLDMLPIKYLSLLYIIIGVIYALLFVFTIPKKIKIGFKIAATVFLIFFSTAFVFGIRYVDKTIDFLDRINQRLSQQEIYYVAVLDDSQVTKIGELSNKNVGIYRNNSYDKVVTKFNALVSSEVKDYESPLDLLEDLDSNEIDAVVINGTLMDLLDTDLAYLDLELKVIGELSVEVKNVDAVKYADVTSQSFNIFVAGGDSYGSIDRVMNTDVNMIISVNPKKHTILLTSIPRDYYVILPSYNAYDKLTHAGYYGIQESILTVENLLDIDINYYVKVNFSTIENLVDAIGGIDVYSDYTFTEDSSHNNYKYVKGLNHLNGAQALAFVRERHSFKDGDVQRVKNQQKVIEAVINKVSSSSTIINNYTKLLSSISDSFATNIESKSIKRLVKMQLKDMSGWSIESQNLVGHGGSSTTCYSLKGLNLYVMLQDEESVSDASNKIKSFMNVE